MPDFTNYGLTEIVDIPDIKKRAFQWAREHEVILPAIGTDIEYSVILNGLRILEQVLLKQMEQCKNNKSAYLFPLRAANKINHLEESLKD